MLRQEAALGGWVCEWVGGWEGSGGGDGEQQQEGWPLKEDMKF